MIGAGALYLISQLHEAATHLTDRYFNRALDEAERDVGQAILKARRLAEVDRLLADEPFRRLKLTSAASFRRNGAVFSRNGNGSGWDETAIRTLPVGAPMMAPLSSGAPFSVAEAEADSAELRLPPGLSRPILRGSRGKPAPLFCLGAVWSARLWHGSRRR